MDQIIERNKADTATANTLLVPTPNDQPTMQEGYSSIRESRVSVAPALLSEEATKNIMTWMPNQHTDWQNWMDKAEDKDVPSKNSSPHSISRGEDNAYRVTGDQLHPLQEKPLK